MDFGQLSPHAPYAQQPYAPSQRKDLSPLPSGLAAGLLSGWAVPKAMRLGRWASRNPIPPGGFSLGFSTAKGAKRRGRISDPEAFWGPPKPACGNTRIIHGGY